MEILKDVPLWGQWGVVGLLIGIVGFIIYAILKGLLVTRSHVEQVQQMADSYREAWLGAQSVSKDQAALIKDLSAIGVTVEKLLNALPSDLDENTGGRHVR